MVQRALKLTEYHGGNSPREHCGVDWSLARLPFACSLESLEQKCHFFCCVIVSLGRSQTNIITEFLHPHVISSVKSLDITVTLKILLKRDENISIATRTKYINN